MRKSIAEFGFVNPVPAWHDGEGRAVIVAGHARCQAARKEGLDEVPVVYEERGIPYFLFGPGLSLFSGNRPCNYLVPGAIVTYENGAKVNTGFVTSYGEWKIDTAPELAQAVADACKREPSAQNTYDYPPEVVTSALIMKIARHGIRFRVKEAECSFVRSLDGQRATGQGLFGGGFLISPEAAAEKAAEKAAERMEADGAYTVELSGRERALVESLSRRAKWDEDRPRKGPFLSALRTRYAMPRKRGRLRGNA